LDYSHSDPQSLLSSTVSDSFCPVIPLSMRVFQPSPPAEFPVFLPMFYSGPSVRISEEIPFFPILRAVFFLFDGFVFLPLIPPDSSYHLLELGPLLYTLFPPQLIVFFFFFRLDFSLMQDLFLFCPDVSFSPEPMPHRTSSPLTSRSLSPTGDLSGPGLLFLPPGIIME